MSEREREWARERERERERERKERERERFDMSHWEEEKKHGMKERKKDGGTWYT